MKKPKIILLVALLVQGLMLSQGHAFLFDTGTPDLSQGGVSYDLYPNRPLVAAQFSNSEEWEIGSIEGYFFGMAGYTQLQANIWNSNTANEVIPGTLAFKSDVFTVATGLSWQGVSSLTNWTLPAGTYWVGFTYYGGYETREKAASIVAGAQKNPDDSLRDAQYFILESVGQWYTYDYDHCIRIGGDTSTVPEPTTMLLLGLGLIGLAGVRRKFKM